LAAAVPPPLQPDGVAEAPSLARGGDPVMSFRNRMSSLHRRLSQ
jgi:hypothetical protein